MGLCTTTSEVTAQKTRWSFQRTPMPPLSLSRALWNGLLDNNTEIIRWSFNAHSTENMLVLQCTEHTAFNAQNADNIYPSCPGYLPRSSGTTCRMNKWNNEENKKLNRITKIRNWIRNWMCYSIMILRALFHGHLIVLYHQLQLHN